MTTIHCSETNKAFQRNLRYGVSASVVDPLLSLLFDLHHLQERVIDHLVFLGVQPESLPEPFYRCQQYNKSNDTQKTSMNDISDARSETATPFCTSSHDSTANVVNVNGEKSNKESFKYVVFNCKENIQDQNCSVKAMPTTCQCELSSKEQAIEKGNIYKEEELEQLCKLEESDLEYEHNALALYQVLSECKLPDSLNGNGIKKVEAAQEKNAFVSDDATKRKYTQEEEEECFTLMKRACYMLACFLATAYNYKNREFKPILDSLLLPREDVDYCGNLLDVKTSGKRERELEEEEEKFEEIVPKCVHKKEILVDRIQEYGDSINSINKEHQQQNTQENTVSTVNNNAPFLMKVDELSAAQLKNILLWWREYEQWIRCIVTDQQQTLHAVCAPKLSETISVHAKWVEVDCDVVKEHKSNAKDEFNHTSVTQGNSLAVQLPLISGVLKNYEELILVNDAFATCQRNVQSALVHLEEAIETCLDESVIVNEYERSY